MMMGSPSDRGERVDPANNDTWDLAALLAALVDDIDRNDEWCGTPEPGLLLLTTVVLLFDL